MSVIQNCRFLLISSGTEIMTPLQKKLDELGVLHFEKCLLIKAAKPYINKSLSNGHIFQYIIVDEDCGSEEDILQFYSFIESIAKYKDTEFIYIKTSVDSLTSGIKIKSSLELQSNSNIKFYSKPLDCKLLIQDIEKMYLATYDENKEFIESIPVDDCIIYKMGPVIDKTTTREMEKIILKAIKKQENTLIFNFKNTQTFPSTEMKHLSQILLKSQKDYPFIHTTSFNNEVLAEMRKGGYTQVFDTKTSFKDLIIKYKIDTEKLKKILVSI